VLAAYDFPWKQGLKPAPKVVAERMDEGVCG